MKSNNNFNHYRSSIRKLLFNGKISPLKQINTINDNSGFTLLEMLLVIALITILSTSTMWLMRPSEEIDRTKDVRAKIELREIAEAMALYVGKNGAFPPDANRDLPNGLEQYLPGGTDWPKGPYENSVYDWDNWEDQTCWNGKTGIIQITLRMGDFGDPGQNEAIYYVIQGEGVPHCSNSKVTGECVNCGEQ